MGRKYGLPVIIAILLLLGICAGIINYFYPFSYLHNIIFKREFAINPNVKVKPDKNYNLKIWYYPFYRTLPDQQGKEEVFFSEVLGIIKEKYPNFNLHIKELSFLEGERKIEEALIRGNLPDIYFNFNNNSWISKIFQVPVENYINKEEREGFYTVDWAGLNKDHHLWGWPFLIQEQIWYASTSKHKLDNEEIPFLNKVARLEPESLILNYYDETLLLQLLTLDELKEINFDGGELYGRSYHSLQKTFFWIDDLRQRGILSTRYKDSIIRGYFKQKDAVIGPVNPWVVRFLVRKGVSGGQLHLSNLARVYTINVFRQKDYQGDDHTRAAMEVAKIISKNFSAPLAKKLGLLPAYVETPEDNRREIVRLLEVNPDEKKYWQEEIWPAWLAFWEENLSPDEVMGRLQNSK